jgi:ubiquinol-cytochrome c reductase cytochrome b subunit
MLSAILVILAMPFTDLSRSRGIQFRPLSKIAFYIFVANFLILLVLGAKHVESPFIEFGQISTVIYFAHFLIIVPSISLLENTLVEIDNNSTELQNETRYASLSSVSSSVSNVYNPSSQRRSFSTGRTLSLNEGSTPEESNISVLKTSISL